jgi:site-specific recombinase XerD
MADRQRIQQLIEADPQLRTYHTRRSYLADLVAFEGWRGRQPLTLALVEQYIGQLAQEGASPSSINRKLSSIRWWARQVGQQAANREYSHLSMAEQAQLIQDAGQVARIANVEQPAPPRRKKPHAPQTGQEKP